MTDSEPIFTVDLESGEANPLEEMTLAEAGLRERDDLQRWISEYPEIVGSELVLITTEFDQWELRGQRVADRLDVLLLHSSGALVVAELKRDHAPDTTDLQALKYAAYSDQLTVDDVVAAYAKTHDLAADEASAALTEHAPSLADDEFAPVRIRLVAGSFGPSVTTLVLWLRDRGIDIGCIEVTAHRQSPSAALLTARQILPLPEAEEYLVRRRRKEASEQTRRSERRALSSVAILVKSGVLEEDDILELITGAFTGEERPVVEERVNEDPTLGRARWTGLGGNRALRWEHDQREYSPTGLVRRLHSIVGLPEKPLAGPDYWSVQLPGGANRMSMYEASKHLPGGKAAPVKE